MKIARIDSHSVKVPYTFGGSHKGEGLRTWTTNNILLVRVETDTGLVGWGEAFCYGCTDAVKAALHNMVAPLAIGQDARDIAGLSYDLQQKLHLFGRYGLTIFALSGLDIALWDIAGKAANLPLYRLLGGARRDGLPAYASLLKYRDPEKVAARTAQAVAEGYRHIKLHETEEPEVRAAREAAGDGVAIMVDTNCPWTPEQARHMTLKLRPYDLFWLEEPIFPPEDFTAIAKLRAGTGVAMAAGENLCTSFQFREMLAAGAVDYAQPSVTKVGGITEFLKVATLCDAAGVTLMPHSPYFGPGFLATLHLLAAHGTPGGMIERYHMDLEASLYGELIMPKDGRFALPTGPGLGRDPDPDVIKTYGA
ncbi:MAG: mandelate racemase/muconate lactonizing enzyme family protein [Reyranella sp.]|uniref:mandelate racemase/muconate lactonizing enzyme family protein n=1 Tax=Reyranella sp. TaxID=1929291 RepID=UPI0012280B07|nr:mandelate racemase/muconate lactonizing enzyme family protein [Reyranella sp.]TAJ41369.1 MAG: mandelate racemase/muconate lactonizing enzyme family protein [Reyranella sp.]